MTQSHDFGVNHDSESWFIAFFKYSLIIRILLDVRVDVKSGISHVPNNTYGNLGGSFLIHCGVSAEVIFNHTCGIDQQ